MSQTADSPGPADRIMEAWVRLEDGLRSALPVCSVQPPRQPSELLSALRINHRIDSDQESRIQALRAIRNRVAHAPGEPSFQEADRFVEEVADLLAELEAGNPGGC